MGVKIKNFAACAAFMVPLGGATLQAMSHTGQNKKVWGISKKQDVGSENILRVPKYLELHLEEYGELVKKTVERESFLLSSL